jgi:hypothetical protein
MELTVSRVTERYAERYAQRLSETPGAIRSRRFREKHKQNQVEAKANDVASAPVPSVTPERCAERYGETPCCDLLSLGEEERKEATEKGLVVVERGKRGTRIEADSRLSPELLQFALQAGMTRDRAAQAWSEFVDYWVSVPGQRGCKLDWSATWRNRVRELTGNGGRQQRQGRGDIQWRSGIPGVV